MARTGRSYNGSNASVVRNGKTRVQSVNGRTTKNKGRAVNGKTNVKAVNGAKRGRVYNGTVRQARRGR